MSAGRHRLLAAGALALLAGCAHSISMSVKSPVGTNRNRPMYMLVRKVADNKQYLTEAYPDVAAKVETADANALLIPPAVIYPGAIQNFKIAVSKESMVAVSFLFTSPEGNNWQFLLTPPLPGSVEVELEGSRIKREPATPSAPAGAAGPPEAPKLEPPKLEAPKLEPPKLPGG